jgi:hypothetical protein
VDCYTRPENAHKNPRNKVNQKALVTTSPTRSTMSCTYCQKTGHTEKNCFKKRNDQSKPDDHAHVVLFLTEHSLFTKNIPTTFSPNTFIADSGATCHMRGSLEGMFNIKLSKTTGTETKYRTRVHVLHKRRYYLFGLYVLRKRDMATGTCTLHLIYVHMLQISW